MTIKNFINDNQKKIKQIISGFADEETAKDIEQDVYIKIWKTTSFDKPLSYIKTIVLNTCKDFCKSKQYRNSKITTGDEDALLVIRDTKETPHQKADNVFRQKMILNAINNLPPKSKEVILLYDIEGYDQNKIAQKLNCPVGTVKSRLYNARKQLQEDLKILIEGDLL